MIFQLQSNDKMFQTENQNC